MLSRLFRQFGGPQGPLGHVAAWLMARQNAPANDWITDLLEVGPDDRVLEVGFGPGLAVERNAARATRGLVAGVDHSELVVRKALRRAGRAAREGRVDLRVGSVEKLPFPDAGFTRAMALNSLQFWPSAEAGLRELHRVLAPGGRLVLGQRLRKADAGRFDRRRYGMSEERLAEVVATLEQIGFRDVTVARREIAGEDVAAIRARKEGR
jgi:ubiquinone/menaquinone biosynthesis C-methylase UbiE